MIEPPQQALFNRMFFLVNMSYRITSILNYILARRSTSFCGFQLHSFTDQQAPLFMSPLNAIAKGKHGLVALFDGLAICESLTFTNCRAMEQGNQTLKAVGSERSAYLLNPVPIPFSRDDVLPPSNLQSIALCVFYCKFQFHTSSSAKLISYFNDFNVLLCKKVLKQRCACKEQLKKVQTEHGRRERQ